MEQRLDELFCEAVSSVLEDGDTLAFCKRQDSLGPFRTYFVVIERSGLFGSWNIVSGTKWDDAKRIRETIYEGSREWVPKIKILEAA